MDIAVLGIDLGKTVCSNAGLDRSGAVVLDISTMCCFRRLGFFVLLTAYALWSKCGQSGDI